MARQIDLSVGSLMAFTGMVIAWMQVTWLGSDTTGAAWLSIGGGLLVGALVGVFQGWWAAYREVPAFVVTLAGYLMWARRSLSSPTARRSRRWPDLPGASAAA